MEAPSRKRASNNEPPRLGANEPKNNQSAKAAAAATGPYSFSAQEARRAAVITGAAPAVLVVPESQPARQAAAAAADASVALDRPVEVARAPAAELTGEEEPELPREEQLRRGGYAQRTVEQEEAQSTYERQLASYGEPEPHVRYRRAFTFVDKQGRTRTIRSAGPAALIAGRRREYEKREALGVTPLGERDIGIAIRALKGLERGLHGAHSKPARAGVAYRAAYRDENGRWHKERKEKPARKGTQPIPPAEDAVVFDLARRVIQSYALLDQSERAELAREWRRKYPDAPLPKSIFNAAERVAVKDKTANVDWLRAGTVAQTAEEQRKALLRSQRRVAQRERRANPTD